MVTETPNGQAVETETDKPKLTTEAALTMLLDEINGFRTRVSGLLIGVQSAARRRADAEEVTESLRDCAGQIHGRIGDDIEKPTATQVKERGYHLEERLWDIGRLERRCHDLFRGAEGSNGEQSHSDRDAWCTSADVIGRWMNAVRMTFIEPLTEEHAKRAEWLFHRANMEHWKTARAIAETIYDLGVRP